MNQKTKVLLASFRSLKKKVDEGKSSHEEIKKFSKYLEDAGTEEAPSPFEESPEESAE